MPARTQETTLVSQVRPKEDGSIAEKGSLPTDWLLWRILRMSKKVFVHLETILFAHNRCKVFQILYLLTLRGIPWSRRGVQSSHRQSCFPRTPSSSCHCVHPQRAESTPLRSHNQYLRKNFEFCSPCWKCLLLPRGFGSSPRGLYWQGLVVDHVCRSPVVQGTPEKYKKVSTGY